MVKLSRPGRLAVKALGTACAGGHRPAVVRQATAPVDWMVPTSH